MKTNSIKVSHPYIFILIWICLGWFAKDYGIKSVCEWIIFVFGAVGLYTLVSKYY